MAIKLEKVDGGNPAQDLHHLYQELMQLCDPQLLHDKALDLVQYRVGQGQISTKNFAKFKRELAGCCGLDKLRFYLTNWMLRAGGLGVIYSGRHG